MPLYVGPDGFASSMRRGAAPGVADARLGQRASPKSCRRMRPRRVGMETGPLAIWLWHSLRALDVSVDCLHARHVAAALSLQVNKTDTSDAHSIAQVVRSGWYRPVVVKSLYSCRVRAVLSARHQLVTMHANLYNQIRGPLTSLTFLTASMIRNASGARADVDAFLGLTPRRYQSGDIDLAGRISKAGDRPARSLSFEAANALMTRVRHENSLRAWGLKLSAKIVTSSYVRPWQFSSKNSHPIVLPRFARSSRRISVTTRSRPSFHAGLFARFSLPAVAAIMVGNRFIGVPVASRYLIRNMAQKDIHVILYRLPEQDRKLDAIHEQTVRTNLEKWQSFIEGGLAI